MRVRISTIFILVCSVIAMANENDFKVLQDRLNATDPNRDPVEFAKTVYDVYKHTNDKAEQAKKSPEYAYYLQRIERERIAEGNICVDCPNIYLLTNQVNDILQHMSEDPSSGLPPGILSEINSLDGMFYFSLHEEGYSHNAEDGAPCKRFELRTNNDLMAKAKEFDPNSNVLLFTKNLSFKNISQAQYIEPGKQKVYFFKVAPPHDDIVIRVIRNSDKTASIAYFKNKETFLKEKVIADKIAKQNEALKPYLDRVADEKAEKERAAAEEKAKRDRLDVDYGWNTEGDGSIPNKVTILSIDGASHFENVSVVGGAELSSKKQAANLMLRDKEGKDFVGVEVEVDGDVNLNGRSDFDTFAISGQAKQRGAKSSAAVQLRNDKDQEVVEVSLGEDGLARLGVPLSFDVYDTGVVVDGKVVAGQGGAYGGNWVIKDRNSSLRYVDLGLNKTNEGTGVSIGHSRQLSEASRISVKISHDDFNQRETTAGWVNFTLDF